MTSNDTYLTPAPVGRSSSQRAQRFVFCLDSLRGRIMATVCPCGVIGMRKILFNPVIFAISACAVRVERTLGTFFNAASDILMGLYNILWSGRFETKSG